MKLKNAAKYFDRDSIYDAYTGLFLFKGQMASYDAASIDGSYQRRRTLSVAPEISLPLRHALLVHGEEWLSGILMSDGFFDAPIRKNSTCMVITDTFQKLTPGQAIRRETGPIIKAHTKYLRDSADSNRSSDYDSYFQIYVAPSEEIIDGHFFRSSNKMYFTRSVHAVPEGFTVAGADEIMNRTGPDFPWSELWDYDAEVNVTVGGVMDPVTEITSPGIATTGILTDAGKLFKTGTEHAATVLAGDRALLLDNAITVQPNMKLIVNTIEWNTVTSQPYRDSTLLHLRR